MIKGNQPCLLLLNDIHVSKDNIPAFRSNWQEALELCREKGIRDIVLGGDLFFSRAAQTLDVLLAVHDALIAAAESGIRLTLANGNHDKVNQEAIRGYCHVFDRFPNVRVVDEFMTLPADEGQSFALHVIAYFPEDGSFCEKLERLKAGSLDDNRLNYLYIHEGINGALSRPNDKELPANIFREFDRIFVAHYHNRTGIPRTNIEYIGSSRQHNFGEDEEKGYTIIYGDGHYEFVRNKVNIRYRVLDVEASQVNTRLSDLLEEIREEGRYRTKVRIHGTAAQTANVDKRKLAESGAGKVEIVTDRVEQSEQVSPASLFEKFDSLKIRENYRGFCREKKIDNVELGLQYLANIETPCGD